MDTYQELQDAVIGLLNRNDYQFPNLHSGTGTTDKTNEWINSAIKEFYRSQASRIPPFERTITGTLPANTDTIPIPEGFREMIYMTFQLNDTVVVADKLTLKQLKQRYLPYRQVLPSQYARDGGLWRVYPPTQDVDFEIQYYRQLEHPSTVTSTTFDVTPTNYALNRLTLVDTGGIGLYFPAGTTETQARTGAGTYTPTLAPSGDNVLEYRFTGNPNRNWLLNEAGDYLKFRAAVDGAMEYDPTDTSIAIWDKRAQDQLQQIIREFTNLEGAGTTPQVIRPGLYRGRKHIYNRRFYGGL